MIKYFNIIKSLVYPPKGSITRFLLKTYCQGKGVEIGPGASPYGKPSNVVYMDKFPDTSFLKNIECISDASHIPRDDNFFDFLISSHCLEHCTDTLKVLYEWKRIVRQGGILFIILPHGERTFDKGRTLTNLAHHIEDYQNKVDESDSSHWKEFEHFSIPQYNHIWQEEARRNDGSWDFEWIAKKGHLHYHVWTQNEMIDILKHIGCRILVVMDKLYERADSFLIIAEVNH